MKVLIRADGGVGVGLGHIMRTLVIAKKLLVEYEVLYVSLNDEKYEKGRHLLKNNNIDIVEIQKEEEIFKLNGDVLIVDKYDLCDDYLERVSRKFKTIVIDDNKEFTNYSCDLIINHNPHGECIEYNRRTLKGAEYTLIRDEFRLEKPININGKVSDILITLGGSDDSNITEELIKNIKNTEYRLHVVIGPAYKHMEKVMNHKSKNIKIYINPNMNEVMKKVDVAVAACGTTLYELAYLGVPTIALILYDNQKLCGEYMKKKDVIELGTINDINEILDKLTFKRRKELHNNMIGLIDGNGVFRIKEEIDKFDNIIYSI